MKKVFTALLLLLIIACKHVETKKEQAENLVKNYLKTALNDPGSYEGISFDTLRISYEEYTMGDPNGRKLDTLAASYIDSSAKYHDMAERNLLSANTNFKKYKSYQHMDTIYKVKSDSVESIINHNGKGYKGKIDGYAINHTYRAKNGFGALMVYKTDFWFNSTLTKIINVQNARN